MAKLTETQTTLLQLGIADPQGIIHLSLYKTRPAAALSPVLGSLRRKGLAEKDDAGRWRLTPAGRGVAEASVNDVIQPDAAAADTGIANTSQPDATTPHIPANENTGPCSLPTLDPGTRRDQILTLLRQEQGASMAGMMAATGWQAHSVRALLSGLRKGGMAVMCRKQPGAPSRYCIQTAGEGSA